MRGFLLLLFCLFSFCAFAQETWVAPVEAAVAENPYKGNVIAAQKGGGTFQKLCWTCHGKNGDGNGPAGANLNPKPKNFTLSAVQEQSDGALFWKITTGKGVMVPYGHALSEEQRWQLVNYIRTFKEEK